MEKKRGRPPGKKKVGRKSQKSEVITIRMSPALKFGAEFASQVLGKNKTEFISDAIKQKMAESELEGRSVEDIARELWDLDGAVRLAKTAFAYPAYLPPALKLCWRVVEYCPYFWRSIEREEGGVARVAWETKPDWLVERNLSEQWENLNLFLEHGTIEQQWFEPSRLQYSQKIDASVRLNAIESESQVEVEKISAILLRLRDELEND